jgi:hypothetical protein
MRANRYGRIVLTSYPPMCPEQVAPVVGWLTHQSCSITGEILVAIAGRVGRVAVAESPGVFRPSWSIEQVGENLEAIRDMNALLVFPVVPAGHAEHLRYSFARAEREGARDGQRR